MRKAFSLASILVLALLASARADEKPNPAADQKAFQTYFIKKFPKVKWDKYHIDILTAQFVLHPDWFDVVVASNLFGDILSDLGPACTGTIGIAPSANINPGRNFPSLFEPVHGSAPDIAGQGIANPVGQIWSAAMMLDHLGHAEAAAGIVSAIETVLAEPSLRTRDLGGAANTVECGKAIVAAL